VLGWNRELLNLCDLFSADFAANGTLNLTYLALNLSHFVNGVAKKHGEVSRLMFAGYAVDAITNGVHAATWTSPPFQALFDRHIPGWRTDNFSLRYAHGISLEVIWDAHIKAKQTLIDYVNAQTKAGFDLEPLTIGFARRATAYKRPYLLFHEPDKLRKIAQAIATTLYAGDPNRRCASTLSISRAAQMCFAANRPAAVLISLSNSTGGNSTPSCRIWRILNLRSSSSVRNSSQATGSSVR
jgi:glycogen phosphorylase